MRFRAAIRVQLILRDLLGRKFREWNKKGRRFERRFLIP